VMPRGVFLAARAIRVVRPTLAARCAVTTRLCLFIELVNTYKYSALSQQRLCQWIGSGKMASRACGPKRAVARLLVSLP